MFESLKILNIPGPDKLIQFLLGNNRLKIFVAFSSKGKDENIDLISKIMSALKVNLHTDCYFIDINDETQFSISSLIKEQKISKILFFGVNPEQLGLKISQKPYEIKYLKGIKILVSHGPDALSSDPSKKRILWRQLQEMFAS